MGRPARRSLQFAVAWIAQAGIDRLAGNIELWDRLDPMDDLDANTIRVGESHPRAATGLVDVLNPRRTRKPRQALKIARIAHGEADPEKPRLAKLGNMDVMLGIGAAHVERGAGSRGAHHAELGQKR